jgi:hypothetical protein
VNEQQPLFAPSKALVKQRQIVEVLTKKKFMFPAQYGSVWLTFNEMLAGEKPSHPRIPASERSGLVDLLKCGLWITDGLLRYLERDLEEAHACFTEAGKYIATSPAIPINLSYSFYRALTALASATPVHASVTLTIEADGMKANFPRAYDAKRVIERLAEADVIIQRMAPWPQKATFDHKRQLLAAERMRVCALSHLGRVDLVLPACAMYEKAAAGASKNGFPLDAALSLELLGRFLFSVDRSTYGLDVMRKAVVAYEAFGAKPKGLRLREEFTALSHDDSSLLQQHLRSTVLRSRTQAGADSAHPPSASTGSASAAAAATVVPNGAVGLNRFSASANAFDAISVLKATASFSTEKSQPKLLKKLMRIVLETAGATRGVLCLEQSNKEWSVELSASVDFDEKRSRSRTWRRNALEEEEGGDEDEKGEDDADRAVGMDLDDPDEHKAAAAEEDTHMEDASVSHPSLGGGHRGHDRSSSSSSTSTGGHHIRLGVNAPLDSTAIGAALPLSVFEFVTNTKEVLVVNVHSPTFSAFARASYFADQRHKPKALLCMPLLKAGSVFGVVRDQTTEARQRVGRFGLLISASLCLSRAAVPRE